MTGRALTAADLAETATGFALLLVPSLVSRLLLGEEFTGIATAVARVAGLALIGLGIACWPGPPRAGMLAYSVTVTVFLAWFGLSASAGPLLWPAVGLHAILSMLLLRGWTPPSSR